MSDKSTKSDDFHIRGGGEATKLLKLVCDLYDFSYSDALWEAFRLWIRVKGPNLDFDPAFMLAAGKKAEEKHLHVQSGLTQFRSEGFIVVAESLQQLLQVGLDQKKITKEELVNLRMVWHTTDQEIEKALGKFLSVMQPST